MSIGNRHTPGNLISLTSSHNSCEGTQVNQSYASRSSSVICNNNRPFNSNPFAIPVRPVFDTYPRPHEIQGATFQSRFSTPICRQPQRTQSVLMPTPENNSARSGLTMPTSPTLHTRRIVSARQNASANADKYLFRDVQLRGTPVAEKIAAHRRPNQAELRRKELQFLNAMSAESKFPESPSTPFSQTKTFLINPTKVQEKTFDGYEGCSSEGGTLTKVVIFHCDFRTQLEAFYDSFKVEIRLTRLNKKTRKMEKYGFPTKIQINGSTLGVPDFRKFPQLNPTVPCPLILIDEGLNCIQIDWPNMKPLSKDSEIYLSMALVKQLTDTDMLDLLLQRPLIDGRSTINMIKEVIDRSVSNGVMKNGSATEVSLVCPLGKRQMISPGRAATCTHFSCFDVETFLQMSKLAATWKCPICWDQINYEDIKIDEYFRSVIEACDKKTKTVKIKSNGDWKELRDKEKYSAKSSGYTEANAIVEIDGEDRMNAFPMDFTVPSAKKHLARHSVEIIFEKLVK